MNNFVRNLRNIAIKVEKYNCSDIEIRTFENEGRTDLSIYTRETNNDYHFGEFKVAKRATNIENKDDFIDYCLIGLPGGRTGWGGYLYPKNLDLSKMKFYSFRQFCHSFFGEELPYNKKITIDELKGLLQIFRSKIGMAKYQCLYEIKYKDSFDGKRIFKGSKYFAGLLEGNIMMFEQINGQDGAITLEESIPTEKRYISSEVERDLNIKLGDETINLGTSFNHDYFESNDDGPFELIKLVVTKNGSIYNAPYFTRDALSKIVELREREIGIGNE